jgi:hypothetical protein
MIRVVCLRQCRVRLGQLASHVKGDVHPGSARRLPPRLRLQADIFIGGRVDIVGDQA